ncbi:MAG TPA: hypothetical protein VJ729_09915 [Nitrososphaeraceae archaeon]|nr:hypothetical protein [Nitrososphaeraceae archaeon]
MKGYNMIVGIFSIILKGAGHGLMQQYPEKFVRVLQTFLTTTPTATTSSS